AGPGEWKCGCHNNSSDFYGRRDLQMGRGYRRKGQRQEFWKETPRPVRNPNENIFETTMCLRMKHAAQAGKLCWSATAVPDGGEGPVSEYRLSSSAVGAAGSDAKAAWPTTDGPGEGLTGDHATGGKALIGSLGPTGGERRE